MKNKAEQNCSAFLKWRTKDERFFTLPITVAVFYLFLFGMDDGNDYGSISSTQIFKPGTCKWSLLCYLWNSSSADVGKLTGIDRNLAVFVCDDLCDCGGMGWRTSD